MNKTTNRKSAPPKEKKQVSAIPSFLQEPGTRLILGITFAVISLYILFSLVGFFFTGGIDQSLIDRGLKTIVANPEITASNPAGKIGAWISDLLINRWFGVASFIVCFMVFITGYRIAGGKLKGYKRKIFISAVVILWISLLFGFITEILSGLLDTGTGYLFWGGGHGYFVSLWLNSLVGRLGTFLLLILSFVIILFFGFQTTFYRWVNYCKEKIRENREKARALAAAKAAQAAQTAQAAAQTESPTGLDGQTGTPDAESDSEESDIDLPDDTDYADSAISGSLSGDADNLSDTGTDVTFFPATEETGVETVTPFEKTETPEPGFDNIPSFIDDFEFGKELAGLDRDEPTEKTDEDETFLPADAEKNEGDITLTVSNKDQEETVDRNMFPTEDYDPTLDLSNYQYPSLDLLEEHSSGNPKVTQEELEENKNKIVETLRNYKIEIIKIKATIGPTVTLYEIVPAPGVKISKIKNLEDDIALSLAALGIRIIAPIPGAGTIGIEVPNQNPEIVSMRGILASKKFQESKYALPIALGRTISNETYTFDLTKMPHLLVAGATGQGKSVGLNAIITSLLYKKHPSQLKFVMVDPKKVELSIYSVIEKHFLAKLPDEEDAIITETAKVVNTLNSLCIEMDSRYDLLKIAQVRNIKEYNEKFVKRQLNPNNGHKFLPYIVVIVDEFADLIMTAGKEVEQPIARIAQLARAVGIHMIIATQRPSTNIITGVIKANFPARIAFKVASMIDSRTILDSPGANQLIGRGDMLISVGSEMVRVQCAFVDTPEVDAVTHFIAAQQSYPSAFALPEYVPETEGLGGISDADIGSRDPLFEEAARLVVNTQQGSTSSIQRRFSIGYNRAGRIMDQLEAAGIVGPFEGSKARQVLIPDEYSLEFILNNNK